MDALHHQGIALSRGPDARTRVVPVTLGKAGPAIRGVGTEQRRGEVHVALRARGVACAFPGRLQLTDALDEPRAGEPERRGEGGCVLEDGCHRDDERSSRDAPGGNTPGPARDTPEL